MSIFSRNFLKRKANPWKKNQRKREDPTESWWGAVNGVEEDRIDEILELIWTLREKGVSDLNQLLEKTEDGEVRSILRMMMRDGLFEVEGNRMVLKEKGEEKAREIIRRHRLTERLLLEIFEMSEDEVEEEACKLEHILSPDRHGERLQLSGPSSHLHPRKAHSQGANAAPSSRKSSGPSSSLSRNWDWGNRAGSSSSRRSPTRGWTD